jgi:hypothetical protein
VSAAELTRVVLALVAGLGMGGVAHAQMPPLPPCVDFVPENANGSVTLCFPPTMSDVLTEMIERDKIQAERHARVHDECGDAGRFGMPDTAAARACRAGIAAELPFPAPSGRTVAVLQRYRLQWE